MYIRTNAFSLNTLTYMSYAHMYVFVLFLQLQMHVSLLFIVRMVYYMYILYIFTYTYIHICMYRCTYMIISYPILHLPCGNPFCLPCGNPFCLPCGNPLSLLLLLTCSTPSPQRCHSPGQNREWCSRDHCQLESECMSYFRLSAHHGIHSNNHTFIYTYVIVE